jgi:Tol biopolymer transport system component/DNA-binding winged helix-turn-helix (wHTH) protein
MSLTLKHTYTFDSFVLDVEEQVLLRDGRMVPLTPKVFETLLLLVQNQGSVVTKQTILNTLWPDVFVEESNITFNITKLRKALGDTRKPPIYIETVPRRGYRFKTEVREILEDNKSAGPELTATTSSNNNGNDSGTAASEMGSFSSTTENAATSAVRAIPRGWLRLFKGKQNLLIVLALLPIAAVISWWFTRALSKSSTKTNQPVVQIPVTKPDLKFEQISAYGNVIAAAISPDGKQVVYAQENTGRQSLWLMQLATFINVQLMPPEDSVYNKVCFSHDGDYIYFVKHAENQPTELYRIPTLQGPVTKLVENVEGNYSLSSDDREIVFRRRDTSTRQDSLYLADLNSKQERLLVTHTEPDWIRGFALSPNGKVVVYGTGETDSARRTMKIRQVDVETGEQRILLTPNWYFIRQIEWLPDGDGLLLLARENAIVNPQIWRMSYPGAELQKLTDDLNNYLLFSPTRDSSKMIAVQSVLESHVWVSDVNGSNPKNIADGRGRVIWTADGQVIYNSGSVLGSDLWIVKPDGKDPKQLSFNAGANDWPSLSPDHRTVVFWSNRTGVQHLWRMDLDGSNQIQLTNGYAERNAAISSDGRWVYYNTSTDNFLWKVGLDGGDPVQLTNEYAAYPSVSPDGKLIACFHFPNYAHEARITVRNTDDMKKVSELTLAPGFWISRSIQWDSASTKVIYAVVTKGKVKLYQQPLYSGAPHEITTLKAEDEFEFAISPNRKQLAFSSTKWNHYAVLIDGFK